MDGAVAGELRQKSRANSGVLAHRCDVTDPDAVAALLAVVADRFGRLDVLINNAGGTEERKPVAESSESAWWRTVEVNLRSACLVTRAALPLLRRSAPSRIIDIGSGLGHWPHPGLTAYSAAKAGLWMLPCCLAEGVWPLGIEVNELVPGPVATTATGETMAIGGPPPFAPSERVKSPAEVAEMALWLASLPPGGPTGQSFSLARRPL